MIPGVEAEASGAPAVLQPTGIRPKRLPLRSLPVLFGLVFTFFLYLPTLSYQFVFDDNLQILGNNHLLSWRYLPDYFTKDVWSHSPQSGDPYYRPIFLVWARFNMALFGTESWGWHLTTLFMHLLVTGLVYLVAHELLNHRRAAIVAAALFTIHPVQVESVAWVSGVTEPLGAAFLLLAFLCYLKQRARPSMLSVWQVLSLTFFGAAMLAKETEVVLPLLIVLYECTAGRPTRRRFWGIRLVPYAAILCVYFGLRAHALSSVLGLSGNWRPAISIPRLILAYCQLLFWPFRLSVTYDFALADHAGSPQFFIGLAVTVACFWLAWWFWKRGWQLGIFLLGWFGLTLAPALARLWLPIMDGYYHDRYLYLPSFALASAAALAFKFLDLRGWRKTYIAGWVGTAGLLAAFAVVTYRQERMWASDHALFSHAVEVAPQSLVAFQGYTAELLNNRGDYRRALATAEGMIKIHPESDIPFMAAGSAAFGLGDFMLAERYYAKAAELRSPDMHGPDVANNYLFLGMTRVKLGRYEAAEGPLRLALRLDPGAPQAHYVLGLALTHLGKWAEARDEFAAELVGHRESIQAQQGLLEAEAHLHSKRVPTSRPGNPDRQFP
jgi:protein O-mannosyl-transferase